MIRNYLVWEGFPESEATNNPKKAEVRVEDIAKVLRVHQFLALIIKFANKY